MVIAFIITEINCLVVNLFLQFVAARFLLTLAVLSSLAGQIALFPA